MAGFSLIPPRATEFAALAQLVEAFHPDTQPDEWGPEHQAVAEAAAIRLLPYVRRVEARERQAVQAGRVRAPKMKSKSATWHRSRAWCEDRAGGRCEASASPECSSRGTEAHHVLMRSQGGSDGIENLLWVCRECHRWIHDHPAVSYQEGWLRKSGIAS